MDNDQQRTTTDDGLTPTPTAMAPYAPNADKHQTPNPTTWQRQRRTPPTPYIISFFCYMFVSDSYLIRPSAFGHFADELRCQGVDKMLMVRCEKQGQNRQIGSYENLYKRSIEFA